MIDRKKEYKRWLEFDGLAENEREELLSISSDEEAKALRFGAPMGFGTAGLRSTMYMGIGCMNRFTVAQATRGIAALIKKAGGDKAGAVIAYDSRNNSELFARVSASILAGAGIKVYIFDGVRPTPELSWAVRELSCMAGINITASHNPKEYNGYKAYWQDGAQIGPDQARIVSEEMAKFDVLDMSGLADFDTAVKDGKIVIVGEKLDEKYIEAVLATAIDAEAVKRVSDKLKVVYTPLHGAGYKMVPEVFGRIGLKHLYTVDAQMTPDGNFPTVKKPNPEYKEAFFFGIRLADQVGSDLVIATDPDSDRVGVMARGADGHFVTISGNKMGALLLDYVINAKKRNCTLPENAYCVKSLVSTEMANAIAAKHGVKLHDVLTGFKFIGEVIKNYEAAGEEQGFLLGFEESYGYLFGTYARDKDAVGASMMILEMTAYYFERGMTLIDALDSLYREYGYFTERTVEIYMEGLDGIERRVKVMKDLREQKRSCIAGYGLSSIEDLLGGKLYDLKRGIEKEATMPSSDVIVYTFDSGDKLIIRPSGTEPKIKIYALLHGDNLGSIDSKADAIISEIKVIME